MRTMLKTLALATAAACLLTPASAQAADEIDFGDDTGLWANDGECDDPRFEGPGVAGRLDDSDAFHDASDCRAAVEAGTASLASSAAAAPLLNAMPDFEPDDSAETGAVEQMDVTAGPAFDFGDNQSDFANDGECDDARFIGEGLTRTGLLSEDVGHDAADCQAAFHDGTVRLRDETDPSMESVIEPEAADAPAPVPAPAPEPETVNEQADPADEQPDPADYPAPPADGVSFNGINFGTDDGQWANDGECDDPRFEGDGMTETPLLAADAYHDASDCLAAWKDGGLALSRD